LASYGCKVVVCGRNQEKLQKATTEVQQCRRPGEEAPEVVPATMDLSDLSSVAAGAEQIKNACDKIDLLVLNAGIMALPERKETAQGFEKQIGTNHFGHFYLTQLLLDLVKKGSEPRVVTLSSSAHGMGSVDLEDMHYKNGRNYAPWEAYGQSKLANLLFAKELARRLEGTGVLSVAVHPGVIKTNLWQSDNTAGWTFTKFISNFIANKDVPQGTSTTIFGCVADDLTPGAYLEDCRESTPRPAGQDMDMARRLWEATEQQINDVLKSSEPETKEAAATTVA